MDVSDGAPDVLAAVESSLCHDPDIEFVVLFGSQATADSHSSSDIDIAVKFAADLSSHERFQKRCFLSGAVQQDGMPFVDLSDIQELPITVAHDAVQGAFLCGDERAFRRFKSDIETAFADRHDDIRRQQRDVIDRIAEEGLGG